MSGIVVPQKTTALIEQAQDIIQQKVAGEFSTRTRRVPLYLHDGSDVKCLAHVQAMMGVDRITAAMYCAEQKSRMPFVLGVESKSVLMEAGHLEEKAVRHVRDAGYWGKPVGTIIIGDSGGKGGSTLDNLKFVESPYKGWDTVAAKDGTQFEVGYDDSTSSWVAARMPGGWDDVVVEGAKTKDDALKKLNSVAGKSHGTASTQTPADASQAGRSAPVASSDAFRDSLNPKGQWAYDRQVRLGNSVQDARAEGQRMHDIGEEGQQVANGQRAEALKRIFSKLDGWKHYTRENLKDMPYRLLQQLEQAYDNEHRSSGGKR